MKNVIFIFLLMMSVSCATKWTASNPNPVDSSGNTLKTDWGQIKVEYDKVTDEGVFFNIEIKNESKSPIKYERGYLSLETKNGKTYQDLQNKYLTEKGDLEKYTFEAGIEPPLYCAIITIM